jgi:hypothetical protein
MIFVVRSSLRTVPAGVRPGPLDDVAGVAITGEVADGTLLLRAHELYRGTHRAGAPWQWHTTYDSAVMGDRDRVDPLHATLMAITETLYS